ncbi:MAG: hypothetical protein COB79_02910 [Zetaproteobacteria bacterium]|nr:MAG: hypothetical protein COB79_02910 [Zetaproteobacteria bacterium]
MRKNKKYVISQNILRYMACLQAKVLGLPVVINAVVIDQLEPAMIQDLFLWELMGAKRDQSGHAIIAKLYQRIERLKCENKQHPFAKANIKDTTSKQSHTLRALSGFDGRSFNNFQKSAQLPENVKAFVEELI